MLILRDIFIWGRPVYLSCVLCCFYSWEQPTRSLPWWEMEVGLFGKFYAQKKFGVQVSTQSHNFFFLFFFFWWVGGSYVYFLFSFTLILSRAAAKHHSNVMPCNSSPRKSLWLHLKTCGQWSGRWFWLFQTSLNEKDAGGYQHLCL